MSSAGNDIVALAAINIARTKQENFYSKILSKDEKELYDNELQTKLPFENFVWLAWSVKESVYKFLQRATPDLVFSPTKIVISRIELSSGQPEALMGHEYCGFEDMAVYKGKVEFDNQILYSRSVIEKDFIFSVVNCKDDFADTCWGIQRVDSSEPAFQSQKVRELLMLKLNSSFPDKNLQVNKSPHGWPVVVDDTIELPLPVSLAHHGHYVAYCFQLI